MATEFDYSATDTSDDVVRSVAAEISGGGLKPLSDEERLERQIWREEQAFLAEERRFEYEQRQAEIEAIARAEHAAEISERNRVARLQLRREYQERQDRQSHDNDLTALRFEANQSAMWRNAVRNTLAYQTRQTLINELEAAMNPPPPPPAPDVIYVEAVEGSDQLGSSDFNPTLWMQKSRSWW